MEIKFKTKETIEVETTVDVAFPLYRKMHIFFYKIDAPDRMTCVHSDEKQTEVFNYTSDGCAVDAIVMNGSYTESTEQEWLEAVGKAYRDMLIFYESTHHLIG